MTTTAAVIAILLCGFLPGIVAGATVAAVLWRGRGRGKPHPL